jgi:hypothetical protein
MNKLSSLMVFCLIVVGWIGSLEARAENGDLQSWINGHNGVNVSFDPSNFGRWAHGELLASTVYNGYYDGYNCWVFQGTVYDSGAKPPRAVCSVVARTCNAPPGVVSVLDRRHNYSPDGELTITNANGTRLFTGWLRRGYGNGCGAPAYSYGKSKKARHAVSAQGHD